MKKNFILLIFIILCSCTNYAKSKSTSIPTITNTSTQTPTKTITPQPTITNTPMLTFTPTVTYTPSFTPLANSGFVDFLYQYLNTDGEWKWQSILGSFELRDSQTFQNDQVIKTVINDNDYDIKMSEILGFKINETIYSKLVSTPNFSIRDVIGSKKNDNYLLETYIYNSKDRNQNPEKIPYTIYWVHGNEVKSIYETACSNVFSGTDQKIYLSDDGNYVVMKAIACQPGSYDTEKPLIINLNTGIVSLFGNYSIKINSASISFDEQNIAVDTNSSFSKKIYITDMSGKIDGSIKPIEGESPNWISDSQFIYIHYPDEIKIFDYQTKRSALIYRSNLTLITDVEYIGEDEILIFEEENGKCFISRFSLKNSNKERIFSTEANWESLPKNRLIWSSDNKWFIAEITNMYKAPLHEDGIIKMMDAVEETHVICRLDINKCALINVTTPVCAEVNSDATLCTKVENHNATLIINFR